MQPSHYPGFGFLDVRGKNDRAQRRSNRKGREQPTRQGIGIGLGHRAEDVAFDTAQREQRQERRNDDRRREEDRT